MPVKCKRMITTIGTPASHRMMSRSISSPPLRHRHHATPVAKTKPRRNRIIPMVAALQRCPPRGRKRDNQARGRHEARKNGGAPGFVCGCTSVVERVIDALLSFLLGYSGALHYKLHKVSAV